MALLTKNNTYNNNLFVLSILDFHKISKNKRNIYLFIHIHTNTID